MTIKKRIEKAVKKFELFLSKKSESVDDIDKLIACAYLLGRKDGAIDMRNVYDSILGEQIERAENCRYHKMAMEIQGNIKSFNYGVNHSSEDCPGSRALRDVFSGIDVTYTQDEYNGI